MVKCVSTFKINDHIRNYIKTFLISILSSDIIIMMTFFSSPVIITQFSAHHSMFNIRLSATLLEPRTQNIFLLEPFPNITKCPIVFIYNIAKYSMKESVCPIHIYNWHIYKTCKYFSGL